jgi:hypothetical protein
VACRVQATHNTNPGVAACLPARSPPQHPLLPACLLKTRQMLDDVLGSDGAHGKVSSAKRAAAIVVNEAYPEAEFNLAPGVANQPVPMCRASCDWRNSSSTFTCLLAQ